MSLCPMAYVGITDGVGSASGSPMGFGRVYAQGNPTSFRINRTYHPLFKRGTFIVFSTGNASRLTARCAANVSGRKIYKIFLLALFLRPMDSDCMAGWRVIAFRIFFNRVWIFLRSGKKALSSLP